MRIALIVALTSAACLQTAVAATITQYDRATFQTALAGATLSGQNFDSLPLGNITTVNGVTYSPSFGTAVVTNNFLTSTTPNGLGSTSAGFFESGETLTLSFSAPITAFAIDINTFGTTAGAYTATVKDGSNSIVPSIFDVFPNNSTGEFIGFADSSPFSSLVIAANPGDPFSYTVDTLVYGDASALSAVPEPSTFALIGLGMALTGLFAFRRKGFLTPQI